MLSIGSRVLLSLKRLMWRYIEFVLLLELLNVILMGAKERKGIKGGMGIFVRNENGHLLAARAIPIKRASSAAQQLRWRHSWFRK